MGLKFKQNASESDRIEAVEHYFGELMRDSILGVSCKHKQINGKNAVYAFLTYWAEDEGEPPTSEELVIFKGNSDEFESVETVRDIE